MRPERNVPLFLCWVLVCAVFVLLVTLHGRKRSATMIVSKSVQLVHKRVADGGTRHGWVPGEPSSPKSSRDPLASGSLLVGRQGNGKGSSSALLRNNKGGGDQLHGSTRNPLKLVICTRIRNEAPYLREWIDHHRMIGFDSFLILNDKSTDDGATQCLLDAYSKEGVVIRLPDDINEESRSFLHGQSSVFDTCVHHLKRQKTSAKNHTWMLTHDTDEFLWFNTSKDDTTLKDVIRSITSAKPDGTTIESIKIPRLLYGSSGHKHYDDTPVLDRFTRRYDLNSCSADSSSQTRRRLFNKENPVSYCQHRHATFDMAKSMSLVSSLADECPWRPTGACGQGPHNHLLSPVGVVKSMSRRVMTDSSDSDSRYLHMDDVGSDLVLAHYMTKSREEFLLRIYDSAFKEKYYKCPQCSPEFYFNLTETYANNKEDDRMTSFSAQTNVFKHLSQDFLGHCDTRPKHSNMVA